MYSKNVLEAHTLRMVQLRAYWEGLTESEQTEINQIFEKIDTIMMDEATTQMFLDGSVIGFSELGISIADHAKVNFIKWNLRLQGHRVTTQIEGRGSEYLVITWGIKA